MSQSPKYKTINGSFLKKTVYDGGVEYYDTFSYGALNLNPSIGGGDSILSRYSLFTIFTNNNDSLINKKYVNGGKYRQFTENSLLSQFGSKSGVSLNYDKTNLDRLFTYGSMGEGARVSVKNIQNTWLGSLYVKTFDINLPTYTNLLVSDDITYFDVNLELLVNNFNINLNVNKTNEGDVKDFISNWGKYVLMVENGSEIKIEDVIISTDVDGNINDMTIGVKSNPFELDDEQVFSYHIKPNKQEFNKYKKTLDGLGYILLENENQTHFISEFKVKDINKDEQVVLTTKKLQWVKVDGVNPSFKGVDFNTFITNLFDITKLYDGYKTDVIYRLLTPENLLLTETAQGEVQNDEEAINRLGETLRIFGVYLDEIKRYIDGISYINNVTYDNKDNTPNELIISQASLYGWDVIEFLGGDTLIKANDYNFWRNIIVNTPHIWGAKGTRKSIEFMLEYMGVPHGLIEFNEHVYLAKNKLNYNTVSKLNDLVNNIRSEKISIDVDGYPKPLTNNNDLYFQSYGGWYRETGGLNSLFNITNRNNPHLGVYDGGSHYWGQFTNLIPNFSGVNVENINTITKTKNYFNLDENDVSIIKNNWVIGSSTKNEFIVDFIGDIEYDDCGCEKINTKKILRVDFDDTIPSIKKDDFECLNGVFYNKTLTQTFYKNDCEICDGNGSMVVYVVESGTYSGSTEEIANNLALNDIQTNGQDYANTHGNCDQFLNTNEIKGFVRKNDCEYPLEFIDSLPKTIKFGRLYNQSTARNPNIGLNGFDTPTYDDCVELRTLAGGSNDDLSKYKSIDSVYWDTPNTDAENLFGFDLRGGGRWSDDSLYVLLKQLSHLWHKTGNMNFAWVISNAIEEINETTSFYSLRLAKSATTEQLLLDDGTRVEDYVDYEGNRYFCRKIGSKIWMCENLITKYDKYGVEIDHLDYDDDVNNSYVINNINVLGSEVEYVVTELSISGCTQEIANENAITYFNDTKQYYANIHGDCDNSIYGNLEISKEFEKNDCGYDIYGNQIKGSVEVITVEPNTFYSNTIYGANKLADDFIERNGQNLANQQGSCLIYCNQPIVDLPLTKNDCEDGYVPTTTIINVDECIFSGFTQELVDQLAYDYAQELANENGECVYVSEDTKNIISFGVENYDDSELLGVYLDSLNDVTIEYTNGLEGDDLISGKEVIQKPLVNYQYVLTNVNGLAVDDVLKIKILGDVTKCVVYNGGLNRIVDDLYINNDKLKYFELNAKKHGLNYDYIKNNKVVSLFNVFIGEKTKELEEFYLGGTVGLAYSNGRRNNQIGSIDFNPCKKLKKLYVPNQTALVGIYNLPETLEELYCFNCYKLEDITNKFGDYPSIYEPDVDIRGRYTDLPNLKILRANATSLLFRYSKSNYNISSGLTILPTTHNLIEINIGGWYTENEFKDVLYDNNIQNLDTLNNSLNLRYVDIRLGTSTSIDSSETSFTTSGGVYNIVDNLPITENTSIINNLYEYDDNITITDGYGSKNWIGTSEISSDYSTPSNKFKCQGVILNNFSRNELVNYFGSYLDDSYEYIYLVVNNGVYNIDNPSEIFNDGDIIKYSQLDGGWVKIN
jgi:hypothetical protein